jgi:hypothetical protein
MNLFFICLVCRTIFVLIAKKIPQKQLPYLGYLALIPFVGFLYQYKFSTKRGFFGGNVWWNNTRPIHSLLYGLFALEAIKSNKDSYKFLLIDVIIGFLSWGTKASP